MIATKPGLYETHDLVDIEEGTEDAAMMASRLMSQAAGISIICSLALESAVEDKKNRELFDYVADTASRLMFKCFDDLVVAENLAS